MIFIFKVSVEWVLLKLLCVMFDFNRFAVSFEVLKSSVAKIILSIVIDTGRRYKLFIGKLR